MSNIWKNPKDELPKDGQDVVVIYPNKSMITGTYDNGEFFNDFQEYFDIGWMNIVLWTYQEALIKQAMEQ